MLTREEALILKNRLMNASFCLWDEDQKINPTINVLSVYLLLDELTEKPKPRAKVGYYYKDGYGNIEMVTEITAIRIITNYGNFYRLDGTEMDGIDDRNNLDLSKPYKLVEVKNVD